MLERLGGRERVIDLLTAVVIIGIEGEPTDA
jgi:hypothetical protein